MICLKFWVDYYLVIYPHCWGLIKAVGSVWQLVVAFFGEGDDGLTLCEQLS
jgi:hypothetical protein